MEEEQKEQTFQDAFEEFADDDANESIERTDNVIASDDVEEDEVIDWEARAAEAEAQSKEWEHKFHSDAGRVGAMQRKINELEAQPMPSDEVQAAEQDETPPELAEFKDDYPDIYQGVEKYMETELQRRTAAMEEQIQQQLEPVNQMVNDQQSAAEIAALKERHPDWQEVAQDAGFSDWVATQPYQIQEMANSDYASEVSYVLDSFKTQSPTQQSQQQPVVQGIAQKRERQLANSTTVPSRSGSSANPLAEDDYSSAFAHYAARK